MRQNKVVLGGAAILLSVGLAACSPGTPTQTGESSGAAAEAERPKISFIQGVIGDEFYVSMECGVRAAAEELGADVDVQGPQKWDPALQQPIVTSVNAAKPDAVLIAPNDVSALQRPLEETAKISKLILVDTTIEDPSIAASEISSDNVGGGAAAFDAIKKLVPEGGPVLVIDNQPGISTSDDRVNGFEEAVATDSKFEYIGVQYAKNQPAEAARIVTSTLQAHPDLVAVFATNIFSAEGAATGIRQAGAEGKVQVIGFDAGPAQVAALEEGTIQGIVAQQPYQIGEKAVEEAMKALKGEPTEEKIKTGFTFITKDMLGTEEGDQAIYKSKC